MSKGNKENIIEVGGRVIGKEWYDLYFAPSEGFCLVKNNDTYNYVNLTSGSLLLSEWCDDAEFFKDGFGKSRKERTGIRLTRTARLPKLRQSNLKGLSDEGKAPKKLVSMRLRG